MSPDKLPQWKQSFQQFSFASELTAERQERQICTLLNSMGDEPEDILRVHDSDWQHPLLHPFFSIRLLTTQAVLQLSRKSYRARSKLNITNGRWKMCRATCWNAKSSVLQGEKREYPIGWHWQNMGLASRHKGAFRDALALCYGWTPSHIPSQCACGKCFTMEHAFSCPYGDFLLVQHNDIRDTTACLLFSKVCRNVALEPSPMARTLKGKALA